MRPSCTVVDAASAQPSLLSKSSAQSRMVLLHLAAQTAAEARVECRGAGQTSLRDQQRGFGAGLELLHGGEGLTSRPL